MILLFIVLLFLASALGALALTMDEDTCVI
jgi:hypothetical protein